MGIAPALARPPGGPAVWTGSPRGTPSSSTAKPPCGAAGEAIGTAEARASFTEAHHARVETHAAERVYLVAHRRRVGALLVDELDGDPPAGTEADAAGGGRRG